MKTFEVELKRTSYITLFIEAESKDEAEDEAWRYIEGNTPNSSGASWGIESIEEMEGYK